MIKIVLVALFICAGASPRWRHHHHHPSPFDDSFEQYMNENVFDTQRFWDQFNRDLNDQMRHMETMLSDFGKRFPSMVSSEGVEGDNYKIVIPIVGFQEKEIIVKARKGVLMIQAVHKVEGQPQNSYLDVRTLPDCVNEDGNWSYKEGVLTIIFPLIKKDGTDTKEVTTAATDNNREETETDSNTNVDIDNGAGRGDIDGNKLLPKESTKVEATTYAVDLNNEVEFVPLNGSS